jgi:hypothetical protein
LGSAFKIVCDSTTTAIYKPKSNEQRIAEHKQRLSLDLGSEALAKETKVSVRHQARKD